MINIFSVIGVGLIIWNEYRWRVKETHWIQGVGVVVKIVSESNVDGGYTDYPVIEWGSEGDKHQFKSRFSNSYKVGQEVKILYSVDSNKAEIYSFRNRWLVTAGALLLCIISWVIQYSA